MSGKQYGLIIPKKNVPSTKRPMLGSRILNPLHDSDEELEKDDNVEETTLNWIEASFKKSAGNSGQKSMQKRILKEAMKEDSTVFQYDEVYDKMKAATEAQQLDKTQSVEKKPKYINTILKQAEKRKLEKERRQERKVQKERDAEGEQFADKESFVTSSYLKKLEEMKKAEEEDRIEKLREECVDVHKHKNFGVFYNHIFNQRLGDGLATDQIKKEPDIEHFKTTHDGKNKSYRARREASASPESDCDRNRRSKQCSDDSTDVDEPNTSNHKRKKIYNTKSESKQKKGDDKKDSINRNQKGSNIAKSEESSSDDISLCQKKDSEVKLLRDDDKNVKSELKLCEEVNPSPQNKIDVKSLDLDERIQRYQILFAKRTVGNAFKDALQLYFNRKSIRESGS